MRTLVISCFRAAAFSAALLCLPVTGADNPAKTSRAPIYDETANGAKQISDALAIAGPQHKKVLLQFGANWCGWCHKLHKLMQTDPQISAVLKKSYVLVLIDVNKDHNSQIDDRYGHPTQLGLPVLVVLGSDGKALYTQDSNKLEDGDHHDPKKVLSFLNQWAGAK